MLRPFLPVSIPGRYPNLPAVREYMELRFVNDVVAELGQKRGA
jgi:hypothetical protein